MKRSHILLLILIVATLGIAALTLISSDTYSSFREASLQPEKEFQVMGTFTPGKEIQWNPLHPDSLTFFMNDNEGKTSLVYYQGPKPRDFEQLKSVIAIGKMQKNYFLARELVLKCPSKYEGQPGDTTVQKK
ncbi:MAG: cytochrome c maturation protein CcmE [Bacteroidota bacterium]